MEIAKQELIVHAQEAASRVLGALSGACGKVPPSDSGSCWQGLLTMATLSFFISMQIGRCRNGWLWTPRSESSFRG